MNSCFSIVMERYLTYILIFLFVCLIVMALISACKYDIEDGDDEELIEDI